MIRVMRRHDLTNKKTITKTKTMTKTKTKTRTRTKTKTMTKTFGEDPERATQETCDL